MDDKPIRKHNRLTEYDYSQNGAYFVTICTHQNRHLFGKIVDGKMNYTKIGRIARKEIFEITNHRDNVEICNAVVMPNHVHILLMLRRGMTSHAPTPDERIWQRGFHDHVVRNDADFRRIWTYIDENPLKWADDCYYISE